MLVKWCSDAVLIHQYINSSAAWECFWEKLQLPPFSASWMLWEETEELAWD